MCQVVVLAGENLRGMRKWEKFYHAGKTICAEKKALPAGTPKTKKTYQGQHLVLLTIHFYLLLEHWNAAMFCEKCCDESTT